MRDKLVMQFLRDNPKFLRRHQSELTRLLRLAERDVIDYTGKQIVSLREENDILRKQTRDWFDAAASNEDLIEFLHRYALGLLTNRDRKKGKAAQLLGRLISRELGIKLCRVIDLKHGKVKLLAADKRRFERAASTVRTEKPLPSFAALFRKNAWSVFLNIPVYSGRTLRAVIVLGSKQSKDFPRNANSDYVLRLAELVCIALEQEK